MLPVTCKAFLVAIPGSAAAWIKNIRADPRVRLRRSYELWFENGIPVAVDLAPQGEGH